MRRSRLGGTGAEVGALCLGTMTWGRQNSEREAHAQLDLALERGVAFIDTAEMYPIPPDAGTHALTERYIGSWGKLRSRRADVVLATKAAGPGMAHIRDGAGYGGGNLRRAVEGSLARLRTDHVDLYQLHWPERRTDPPAAGPAAGETPFEEVLGSIDALVREGKVRAFGLSNETPWGVMRFLSAARAGAGPAAVSVQNPYNLLDRTYEDGLAEVSLRERCGLLAYSPLAFGTLTGKHLDAAPPGSRLALWPDYRRYSGRRAREAARRYVELARTHGIPPARMAIAFVASRPFVTSAVIGATSLAQLAENIDAAETVLEAEVVDGIEAVHRDLPNPATSP